VSFTAVISPESGRGMPRSKFRSLLLPLLLMMALWLPAPAAQALRWGNEDIKNEGYGPEKFLTGGQAEFLSDRVQLPEHQVEVTMVGDPPIVIRADAIESDRNTQLNHFVGQVSITRGEEIITADRAVWNDATNTAEVSGNIKIVTPDFTVLAQRAVINMDLQMAKIYDGRAFFPAQNYYLSGALIERLGEKTIHIKEGTATTCDGPNPAWTIQADSLTVTEGGYATASGVSFNTSVAPIMAMPYFVFPVKNERQSGLLFPGIANSSRDGFTIGLPIFWATGENHDLTYTPVWRSERGLSNTLEGRYHFEKGRGIWQITHLDDKDPQSFYYKNNAMDRQNTNNRYWLRAQNQWRLGEWDVNLNLDLASDPLYLAEFRNDFDGFNNSFNMFAREFGYTTNEYLDPLRNNTLYAQKTDYDTFIRGTIEYTEDLYSQDNRDTIQRLPSLQYNLVSRPWPESMGLGLANLPRVSLGLRYDYFSRTSNDLSLTDETGHRMQINPSMNWSSPLGGLATMQLDGDLGLTMYAADGRRPSNNTPADRAAARHDSRDNRLTGSMTASLSTTLSRVYGGGLGEAVATRHQMSPTLSYTHVEASGNQSDLPYWDPFDRRLPRRTVRYGLLNTFVSKTPAVDENGQNNGFDYFQFLKIGLWSSYEFRDNMEWAKDPYARYYTTDYYDRGAGPVELEIETFLNPFFSARLVSGIDGRTGKVTSHDLSFKAQDARGDSLTLTYDFDSPSTALGTGSNDYEDYEEVRADLTLVLNSEWTADFSSRYDLRVGRSLETHARLLYRAQCYGVGLLYSDSDNDRRVGLVIDLLGLGSINYDRSGLASPPQFFYQ